MAKLKDIYYTDQMLDGTPEPSAKALPISFYQGEDVLIEFTLFYNEEPVDAEKWDISGFVKKNKYARTVLWEGNLDGGISKTNKTGSYKLLIPAEASACFVPGTYWLTVTIKEKAGTGQHDLTFVVMNQPFSIDDSAASPYNRDTLDTLHTERTYPPSINGSTI